MQIVSRGSTATEAATLTYHRGTPDGEVVATTNIPALQPGEMLNLSTEINVALPEGEMIYVEAESSGSENMLYNNSTQCVVKEPESSQLSVQAVASSADGGTAMKLSVQLSNNTSTEVAPLVMAAVYDVTTGKMLSYQLVNDQSMAAISSLQKELVFDLPAAGTLNYKVFVLEPGSYKPLMPNISGSYSAAVE